MIRRPVPMLFRLRTDISILDQADATEGQLMALPGS